MAAKNERGILRPGSQQFFILEGVPQSVHQSIAKLFITYQFNALTIPVFISSRIHWRASKDGFAQEFTRHCLRRAPWALFFFLRK